MLVCELLGMGEESGGKGDEDEGDRDGMEGRDEG